MKPAGILFAIAALCLYFLGPALAAGDGTITVDDVLAPLRPYITEIVGVLITAFVAWLASWLRTMFGVTLDEKRRAALHSALDNAAWLVGAKIDRVAGGTVVPISNPVLQHGVDYVLEYAPDAVNHFGLAPEDIGRMLRSRIGGAPAT